MSLSKDQRLGSCSCEWNYCIKIPLGDKMHFIHSSSVFNDEDNGVCLQGLWLLHVLIFCFQNLCWVSHIFLGLKKQLWYSLYLLKIDQCELPRWNICTVALASCKGILSHIWLLHLWEAPAHTSCNLSRSWKALSFMKWGCASVREATAVVSLFLLSSGFTWEHLSLIRDGAVESYILWEQEPEAVFWGTVIYNRHPFCLLLQTILV